MKINDMKTDVYCTQCKHVHERFDICDDSWRCGAIYNGKPLLLHFTTDENYEDLRSCRVIKDLSQ